jgi:hypothetical protein
MPLHQLCTTWAVCVIPAVATTWGDAADSQWGVLVVLGPTALRSRHTALQFCDFPYFHLAFSCRGSCHITPHRQPVHAQVRQPSGACCRRPAGCAGDAGPYSLVYFSGSVAVLNCCFCNAF